MTDIDGPSRIFICKGYLTQKKQPSILNNSRENHISLLLYGLQTDKVNYIVVASTKSTIENNDFFSVMNSSMTSTPRSFAD